MNPTSECTQLRATAALDAVREAVDLIAADPDQLTGRCAAAADEGIQGVYRKWVRS